MEMYDLYLHIILQQNGLAYSDVLHTKDLNPLQEDVIINIDALISLHPLTSLFCLPIYDSENFIAIFLPCLSHIYRASTKSIILTINC